MIPADPTRSHAAIEATVGQVLAAGALPVVLGGDHSITEPCVRACAAAHGPGRRRPLRHPHRHRRRGLRRRALARDVHAPPGRRRATSTRARYAQIGLRGYWPGEAEFAWQAERGITSLFMHDVRDLGIREVVAARDRGGRRRAGLPDRRRRRARPRASSPAPGTPEPGGMTPVDLLLAVRTVAAELDLVGVDVVEVIPDRRRHRTTTPRSSPSASCARR